MNKNIIGFTIVELLVVITVIAILATITAVSYNVITNRGSATNAKANAIAVAKVAESYNSDTSVGGVYPANITTLTNYNGSSKLPSGVNIIATALSAIHKDGKTIQYLSKSGYSGACIGYWDSSLSTPAATYTYTGNASNGNNSAQTCS